MKVAINKAKLVAENTTDIYTVTVPDDGSISLVGVSSTIAGQRGNTIIMFITHMIIIIV